METVNILNSDHLKLENIRKLASTSPEIIDLVNGPEISNNKKYNIIYYLFVIRFSRVYNQSRKQT